MCNPRRTRDYICGKEMDRSNIVDGIVTVMPSKQKFKNLLNVRHFLGIVVARSEKSSQLNQEACFRNLAKRFNLEDEKPPN